MILQIPSKKNKQIEIESPIPNPMEDLIDEVKQKKKLKMVEGPSKSKPNITTPRYLLQSQDSQLAVPSARYNQLSCMLPISQGTQQSKEIQDGEECIIEQRIILEDNEQIRDIFKKISLGYNVALTTENSPIKEMLLIQEPSQKEIGNESSTRMKFKNATKKVQQFKLVSEALKLVEQDDVIEQQQQQPKLRIDLSHVNNFLNPVESLQSSHQLKDTIEQNKKQSMRRYLKKVQSYIELNNINQMTPFNRKQKANENKLLYFGIFMMFFMVIFVLAYIQSISATQSNGLVQNDL